MIDQPSDAGFVSQKTRRDRTSSPGVRAAPSISEHAEAKSRAVAQHEGHAKEQDARYVSPMAVPSHTRDKEVAPSPPNARYRVILALLLAALLLMVCPGIYCLITEGHAQIAARYRMNAHSDDDKSDDENCLSCVHGEHSRPALQVSDVFVNEVVAGGINGVLMMVATVIAGVGADVPAKSIFVMGTASLTAYSVSTGLSAFAVEWLKEEFSQSQLQLEYNEVRSMPDEEISEMICHYRTRGLSDDDAQTVAGIFSKYEDFWVHHMMAEELGIPLPRGNAKFALTSGMAMGTSFLFFGMIPLLGVSVPFAMRWLGGEQLYRPQLATIIAMTLSATVLLLMGVFLCRAVGSRSSPIYSGLFFLSIGCFCSLFAFWVGQALSALLTGSRESGHNIGSDATITSVTHAVQRSSSSVDESTQSESFSTAAWPAFRDRFRWGVAGLWVAVASLIVISNITLTMESFRVFAYGWLTCITTGLGAVPFMFVGVDAVSERPLAFANAVAGGMMLSASAGMLVEAHEHCGPHDWQILAGLVAGGLFIRYSEKLHGDDEEGGEGDVAMLHTAVMERKHFRKAMLIFTVMFCHSAAEGIAVGVAFSRQLRAQFGLYVSLLLAVHNIPEGLAVALVLVPRGISASVATIIATLTSVPQPLLALAAFLFVDTFSWLLPLGLAFAAGAMVYVCLHELLQEASEHLGWRCSLLVTVASFASMTVAILFLQTITGM